MAIEVEELFIDEQLVIVPTLNSWDYLMRHPIYKDLPVFLDRTEHIVRNLVEFVSTNKINFCLGIYKAKNISKSWLVVPLFRLSDRWQRVQIEYPTCLRCGWQGAIANPTEPSLYFGLNNEQELTAQAFRLSRLGCPACSHELSRFAIWTEASSGVRSE